MGLYVLHGPISCRGHDYEKCCFSRKEHLQRQQQDTAPSAWHRPTTFRL